MNAKKLLQIGAVALPLFGCDDGVNQKQQGLISEYANGNYISTNTVEVNGCTAAFDEIARVRALLDHFDNLVNNKTNTLASGGNRPDLADAGIILGNLYENAVELRQKIAGELSQEIGENDFDCFAHGTRYDWEGTSWTNDSRTKGPWGCLTPEDPNLCDRKHKSFDPDQVVPIYKRN